MTKGRDRQDLVFESEGAALDGPDFMRADEAVVFLAALLMAKD